MELYYRKLGKGKPLILLHGLYGSSDNWYTAGKQLSTYREVYLVDLRNHGRSPHHPVHTYPALRDDLHEFIIQHNLFRPTLIGHSMGGRVAVFFAALHPKLIEKLIVVDISPCSYEAENHPEETLQHKEIIRALQSIDIAEISSRKAADIHLSKSIPSFAVRQFLLKNLKAGKHKRFHWSLNLPALEKNLPEIFLGINTLHTSSDTQLDFPSLFIRGELSGYIREKDVACIKQYFKNSAVVTIPGATHWLPAEKPELFLKTVMDFLDIERE
ncbi:MAG: alpha/beta fold hydrolase [Bacteroidales bacterium]|nr:alpha/beta fold hydrolase [Bacteroidales bacterium]MBN2764335.1 alpha/beta fold hydrolase [Bacteroidales bacterium]